MYYPAYPQYPPPPINAPPGVPPSGPMAPPGFGWGQGGGQGGFPFNFRQYSGKLPEGQNKGPQPVNRRFMFGPVVPNTNMTPNPMQPWWTPFTGAGMPQNYTPNPFAAMMR